MTTLFNYDPYYDDFDEDENFMRVLFRPGYAVQARELTQLQTILSNQIERFGNHIFKSGSPIIGGRISTDSNANYIVLNSQYNSEDVVPSVFLNKTIVSYNSTKTAKARVVAVDIVDNNPVLVIKYLSGDRFTEDDELKIFGQNIFGKLRSTNSYGGSYVASIQDGVYYFNGQFVKIVPQIIVVELFYRTGNSTIVNTQPSYKLGIEFENQIIDEIDDTSLLDPSLGSSNYQAPGANRFKIAATLSKRTIDSSDISSFIEVIRLVNGVKTKELEYPIYSEIEKTLARRTYEESGNYTIDPFVLSLEEGDSSNGYFDVVLDPGKAYIGGYEFQTISPTKIQLARARETSNVVGYDLSTNYESTLVLKNLYGPLDVTSFPLIDIHSTVHANVNVTNTIAYNSTKIGTIRADMIQFNDATNSDIGTTFTYTVNVFGANSSPITGNVASGSTNTVIKLPSNFNLSAGANVYANMLFRITQGSGLSISPILISSSDSTANTITLSTALPFTPGTANTFSIETDITSAESLVIRTGNTKSFGGNIDDDSKNPVTGYVQLEEENGTALIFSTPFGALEENSISDMDFNVLKKYNVNYTGTQVTVATTSPDTWAFSTLSDSIIRNNIICFVKSGSNSTYGISPNTVLSLANNNFSLNFVSSSQFTINLNVPESISLELYVTTKINDGENTSTGVTKSKNVVPTSSASHLKVPFEMGGANTLADSNTVTNTAFTGGVIFEDIGATNFTDITVLKDLRTPGKVVSLGVPDVVEIVRITDSKDLTANVTTSMLSSGSYDVTDNYEFDNGQRKTHYDHATIKLKRGFSSPRGRVFVQYRYLKHEVATGLFTVDSYVSPQSTDSVGYANIPSFNNKEDQKIVSLRSAFDFRPKRTIGDSTSLTGALNPIPSDTMEVNFNYYLSRIDQIVVTPSKEFSVIKGKAAISPVAPPVDSNDMLIYTLSIPAYTESAKDIVSRFYNNRRYKMQDIGAFENRIKQLEYYVTLNSLERDASSTKIMDANGLERSKYGIVTDGFVNDDIKATRVEVGDDSRCLITNGELLPASLMRTVKFSVNNSLSSGATRITGVAGKQVMTLNYTPVEFASQPFATKSIPIANALFANFKGVMKLYPEFSGDVDTETTAKVTLNSNQDIESAFNFINDSLKYIADQNVSWRDDINSPFAQIADARWYETRREIDYANAQSWVYLGWVGAHSWGTVAPVNDNTYLTKGAQLSQKQISTTTSEISVGEFVTDLSIQPYMKSKQIIFIADGVRPRTTFFSFFDDIAVNQYIVVPNKVTLNANTTLTTGEPVLIANSTVDLAANLSSLLSGGTSWKAAYIVVNEKNSANVSIINETGSPLRTNNFIYGINSGKTFRINDIQEHHSAKGVVSGNTIVLDTDASSINDYYNGNTITIVRTFDSFDGIGEQYTISDYVGSTRTVILSSTATTTGNVIYSIGNNRSNKVGQVGGAFYMPKATFRSGQRHFRVTESFNNTYDGDAISFADKLYVSSGISASKTQLVDTVYNYDVDYKIVGQQTSDRLVSSRTVGTEILATWYTDPLAQTFFVDPQVYPDGMFLDSVDLFFKAKDDELPVWVQIRPTVNGYPSSDFWYPESIIVKEASEVNVSETPSVTNVNSLTNFKFYSPVYLKPGLYALVVLTDSPDYVLWTNELGGTTQSNEKVSINPYVGTLYKSQNSMEYVPYINEDMMFRLNRCSFSTSAGIFYLENDAQSTTYNVDKFRLLETAIVPNRTNITHSVATTTINDIKETSFREMSPQLTYSMQQDDLYIVGDRRKKLGAKGSFTVKYQLSTTSDKVSPVVSIENSYLNIWENFIENASINEEDFVIIEQGSGYSNANTITFTSSTGTGASANLVVDANGNVVSINVISSGSGYIDNFDIAYYAHPTTPATISVNSEFDSSGGPCLSRYITKQIILADGFDAGDIRVFLAANKPVGTEIHVFVKILSGSDSTEFRDRNYQSLVCLNPTVSPSATPFEYRDYEYRPSVTDNFITYSSDSGVTYDTFKSFAVKIVMTSSDPAVIPKVRDLRIIALPAE
jgi:hypothetical protein